MSDAVGPAYRYAQGGQYTAVEEWGEDWSPAAGIPSRHRTCRANRKVDSILKLMAHLFSNIKPKRPSRGMVMDSDILRLRNVEYVDTAQVKFAQRSNKIKQDQNKIKMGKAQLKGELIQF